MRKIAISILILLLVCVVTVFCATRLLSHEVEDSGGPPQTKTAEETGVAQGGQAALQNGTQVVLPATDGMQTYNNGVANFAFDASKLIFQEIPSDEENGYPMTSFLPLSDNNVLPRLDIFPLALKEPFAVTTTNEEWEALVKSLLLGYYTQSEWDSVAIALNGTVVKPDNDEMKMYTRFTTTLDGSATPNLGGVARLIANDKNAVVTIALASKGSTIPDEMLDVYMSATLN